MTTIGDVARHAGVATSTVSYVLSGKRATSPATRERVRRAIAELGYRPHAGARALASARTQVLALMVPLRLDAGGRGPRSDLDLDVVMQFVAGVAPRARSLGYDVLLLTDDDPTAVGRVSVSSSADALIVMDVEVDDARIPAVVAAGTPTVLIGLPDEQSGLSCVDFDFEQAGRLAVRHLARLGHRVLAFVGPPPAALRRRTSYAERMLRGLRAQAASSEVELRIAPATASRDDVVHAIAEALDTESGATALVVHNEAALPIVLDVLAERGVRVPADVSVIAVGVSGVAEQRVGVLTSIDIPGRAIGAVAAEMVVAALGGAVRAETRLVRANLTDRGTTARPPARRRPTSQENS
ncbi:transcriptional regulator, LacI family [Beutenbergia cavernae DSM 12333]|uniref:Transcriptional regulator, LacI family n=1 Tax=Beutenbergia cavernae (strain ATCC BAA-8 / DSM 12333 / CCUG 43141 / JCM 11478 / NBRC 16432 / NCIMB 13614 / HKI 0122) TaxID=471853 RepID=C5C1V8_BEUC1|nr:LacI family DNA-binding transcriptional regulator [Beutenbergia cavernae]ACQ79576.1 transcriptional regulator, LacI family [Beutenbergia cavernae DSM 12333]